jgi:hypothetical protein
MKKQETSSVISRWIFSSSVFTIFALVFLSCQINPGLEEVRPSVSKDEGIMTVKGFPGLFALPVSIGLDKVDLYLEKGGRTTEKYI